MVYLQIPTARFTDAHALPFFQKLALHVQALQPAAVHEASAGRRPGAHGEHRASLSTVHAWVWLKPGLHT